MNDGYKLTSCNRNGIIIKKVLPSRRLEPHVNGNKNNHQSLRGPGGYFFVSCPIA